MGRPPADFGTRFSAFVIDALMLFGALWVVVFVVSRQLQAVGMTSLDNCADDPTRLCEGPSPALRVLLVVIVVVGLIAYHAVFEGTRGATPGKYWMGLEVRGIEGALPVGLQRGVARGVVRQLFWLSLFLVLDPSPLPSIRAELYFLVPLLPLAGLAVAAITPSGRGLHDWVGSTVVVHADGSAGDPRGARSRSTEEEAR